MLPWPVWAFSGLAPACPYFSCTGEQRRGQDSKCCLTMQRWGAQGQHHLPPLAGNAERAAAFSHKAALLAQFNLVIFSVKNTFAFHLVSLYCVCSYSFPGAWLHYPFLNPLSAYSPASAGLPERQHSHLILWASPSSSVPSANFLRVFSVPTPKSSDGEQYWIHYWFPHYGTTDHHQLGLHRSQLFWLLSVLNCTSPFMK